MPGCGGLTFRGDVSLDVQAPAQLDPDSPSFLDILRASAATEIWHKHGSFYDHLHDVWQVMCVWKLPRPLCRLGTSNTCPVCAVTLAVVPPNWILYLTDAPWRS